MKTPLAWLNLWHDKARTATALTGTAFAVVLLLMQLGFLRSVVHTADLLYEQLEFDVVITSEKYRQMLKTGWFPRERLMQAAAVPEVREALPISFALHLYRNPETGTKRSMLVVGVDPRRHYLNVIEPEQLNLILPPDRILLDLDSRPEHGPREVGLTTQLGDRTVHVAGLFRLGCGFGADGTVIASDATFASCFYPRTTDDISLGLVQLHPGADRDAAVAKLQAALPPDVVVLSRETFMAQEEWYWVVKTSVGVIFGLGVLVSLLVGAAIVYQVLSSDVAKRMPEYATLKAMGYPPRYLTQVILTQAATIGALGFLPGWLISIGLYAVTRQAAHIWLEMGLVMPVSVFVLSVLMCASAGLMSIRKVHSVAPAELFA